MTKWRCVYFVINYVQNMYFTLIHESSTYTIQNIYPRKELNAMIFV